MNRRTANGERGAILAQVAISMLMLMGFAAFVLDYGVVLVSRGQAQNSADAGALAGAISRAFDDITNPPPAGGVVELAATDVAQDNVVWNSAGSVAVSYACPPGVTGGGCVRVDVYRNGELASPTLPVLFAPVFGITSQGVRATATAQATSANGADCLKPWAVADKWLERDVPPWTQLSTFDPGNPATDDVYIPPYSADTTGFKRANASGNPVDTGYQMTLKLAHPGPAPGPGNFSSGWAMSLYLPNTNAPGEGADELRGQHHQLHDRDDWPGDSGFDLSGSRHRAWLSRRHDRRDDRQDEIGRRRDCREGFPRLVDRRPRRSHHRRRRIERACVVPIALFDTALYLSQGYNGTNGIVKLVGILGFFVEGLCEDSFYKESYLDCSNNNKDVVGRLVSFPGIHVAGAGENTGGAAFGMVIRLVR